MTSAMSYLSDQQYGAWLAEKRLLLMRPRFDCGCPNDGEVYLHTGCPRLACRRHAQDPHVCLVPPVEQSRVHEEMKRVE